ncbi:hypothetical protein L6R52_34490, partial [Myxococcota bacterium]|nr:hypothetical protein [Myxococcota bacterium]
MEITVRDAPELGSTRTRADGVFDLVVNGGGRVTLDYRAQGYLDVQRTIEARAEGWSEAPEVALVALDPIVTRVEANAQTSQIARGSIVLDESGERQATLLFPAGTRAEAILPDGTTRPLSAMSVRATEYTVGVRPDALPGELPPTSAYTYAVELSVDQAIDLGATTVEFDRPIAFYLDNFLGFPVGTPVPHGRYDHQLGAWAAEEDGVIIGITSIATGFADVDLDGDGAPEDATALATIGIDLEERARLAELYAPGHSVWRLGLRTLSPHDPNYPYRLPPDAKAPNVPPARSGTENRTDDPSKTQGYGTVSQENQTFAESLPVTGAGLSINYSSDRMPGYRAGSSVLIPVSGSEVPSSLIAIRVRVSVAGRSWTYELPPLPDQTLPFVWDGRDRFGRFVTGAQAIETVVENVFEGVYLVPSARGRSFGLPGEEPLAAGQTFRAEYALSKEQTIPVGATTWDGRGAGLGGWSLSPHHAYDRTSRTVYLGTGERQSTADIEPTASVFSGTGNDQFSGDGADRRYASYWDPSDLVVAPDGAVIVNDWNNQRLRRIDRDGRVSSVRYDDPSFRYAATEVPFSFTDISATGTLVTGGNEVIASVPIGFDFTFYGQTLSMISVSSNGFLSVDGRQENDAFALPYIARPNGMIAGWWANLTTAVSGQIRYQTVGNAPSRQLVVQYTDVPHSLLASAPSTFQIVLFEGSNAVEIRCASCRTNGEVHTVGVEAPTGYDGLTILHDSIDVTSRAWRVAPGTPAPRSLGYAVDEVPFTFEDVSVTGTPLSLGRFGLSTALPIGFDFPFFGSDRSNVYVHANGFLTFLPVDFDWIYGYEMPTPGPPTGMIAGWWSVLDPTRGSVTHETLGTAPNRRFVVQFTAVPYGSRGEAPSTFQVVLFEGGDFEIRCQSCATTGAPHTIGFESYDGSLGQLITTTNGALTEQAWRVRVASTPPIPRASRVDVDTDGVAMGPKGDLYFTEYGQVFRIGLDGSRRLVAGAACGGACGHSGDGGPAISAGLESPGKLAIAPDGTVFIADGTRIRRVGPEGNISTYAGNGGGAATYADDGLRAVDATIGNVVGLALAPDGTLYFSDDSFHAVRRITPDGTITTVAGPSTCTSGYPGCAGFSGDGGDATAATLSSPDRIALAPDGSLYVIDYGNACVRRVSTDGIITRVLGTGISTGPRVDGAPAATFPLQAPQGIAVAPDGRLFVSDTRNNQIIVVDAPNPAYEVGGVVRVPSRDGRQLWEFTAGGRHLRTLDALTGATLVELGYDAGGLLTSIDDLQGNVVRIERLSNGAPDAIIGIDGQRTALQLDARGFLMAVTNPAGETTLLEHDEGGLLTGVIGARGDGYTASYGADGRVVATSGPEGLGLTITREDLPRGYAVVMTNAMGEPTTLTFSALEGGGSLHVTTRPDGTRWQEHRSPSGVTTVVMPDGTVHETTTGPDPRFGMNAPITTRSVVTPPGGAAAKVVTEAVTAVLADPLDPLSIRSLTRTLTTNGRTTSITFDVPTRTRTLTSPLGRSAVTVFDERGRTVEAQIPGIATLHVSRDLRGREVEIVHARGTTDERRQTTIWDALGNAATTIDGEGRVMSRTHDLLGNKLTSTFPDGAVASNDYLAGGLPRTATPPGRGAHTFGYDLLGQAVSYTPPGGFGSTAWTYDLAKRVTAEIRPTGEVLTYTRDAAGHVAGQSGPSASVGYARDASTGALRELVTDTGQRLTLGFGGALLTSATWSGPVAGQVSFAYDADFRMSSRTVAGGAPVTFAFDADGATTRAGALSLVYSSATGQVTSTTLGGVTDARTYSTHGELATYSASFGATSLYAVTFTRDRIGRVVREIETVAGAVTDRSISYDLAGRVVAVVENGATVESYGYDDNGNRTSSGGRSGSALASHGPDDRLLTLGGVTYTHDLTGTRTGRADASGATSYVYDVFGSLREARLASGQVVEYLVDGSGRRVARSVDGVRTSALLYEDLRRPAAELDASGAVRSEFVYASSASTPDYVIRGGTTYRIIKDGRGSVRLVVDAATGAIAQRLDYDVFGRVLYDSAPGFQPFGFAGGIYDPLTGLVRFGVRDYDAESGRFTAKDPAGFRGADTNLYAYVRNDPVNRVDPSGLGPTRPWTVYDVLAEQEPAGADQWLRELRRAHQLAVAAANEKPNSSETGLRGWFEETSYMWNGCIPTANR